MRIGYSQYHFRVVVGFLPLTSVQFAEFVGWNRQVLGYR